MSKIDTLVWIGSYKAASNEHFLKIHKIRHILNCAKDFNGLPKSLADSSIHYKYFRVPLVEQNISVKKTEYYFRKAAAKLNEWIQQGHPVIVHCYQGISRSVSVVMTYYIVYKGWSFYKAYAFVKSHRHYMHPLHEFIPILKSIAKKKTRKTHRYKSKSTTRKNIKY